MIQKEFAYRAKAILEVDENVIGLAVVGSWMTEEMDEFSDLDLIIVTKNKISDRRDFMIDYAKSLGNFLSGFTGEHVGEPRVLICLFDDPLLHVDIKFLTLEELKIRIENPIILLDKDDQLQKTIKNSSASFPYPDYQWIEDRFWTWVHYALLKIGRGEYLESLNFMAFFRMVVFGPLLHIKNENLPRGVRKVETMLKATDMDHLRAIIPNYEKKSLIKSLKNAVILYKDLRSTLYPTDINLGTSAEKAVMKYFEEIEQKN